SWRGIDRRIRIYSGAVSGCLQGMYSGYYRSSAGGAIPGSDRKLDGNCAAQFKGPERIREAATIQSFHRPTDRRQEPGKAVAGSNSQRAVGLGHVVVRI